MDIVWAKEHYLSNAVEGIAAKLEPRFDGTFTIKNFTSSVICILGHNGTRKLKTAHISDLKSGSTGAGEPGDFQC
ncbi:GM11691 [Drosophila sechellia]|uniref:GM11691 n=1 Tax=Drosophila sechellia TaxID=7238 RepID=B4IL10_DROSE|nr:GM11691 [Drosophila sechellia]